MALGNSSRKTVRKREGGMVLGGAASLTGAPLAQPGDIGRKSLLLRRLR